MPTHSQLSIVLLLQLLYSSVLAQTAASSSIDERADSDPNFAPAEDQFLIFPMLEKDFENWNSLGSAVFLQNKAVLAPEASLRKGLIHTTKPNEFKDHWYAVLDFNIGREKVKELDKAGDGLAIYYVSNIDSSNPDITNNIFGFADDFDGVGIFVNTMKTQAKNKHAHEKKVAVSSFANDGKVVSMQMSPDKTCYRELTGKHLHFSKIAIEYERPMLSVSVYDHTSSQFVHCFSQEIVLDYNGFFVISASSGFAHPQYNYVNSFKVFDPTNVKSNHRFEDSHALKAEREHYATSIAETISDLIHDHDGEEENFQEMDLEEALETIASQDFFLQSRLEGTHYLLASMAQHFHTIAGNVNEVTLYDHNVHLNENLFQTYFNMSMGLATELNYLEKTDDELEQVLEQQVKDGDVAARNRRRKNNPASKPLEVNNVATKKLQDSLYALKTKVATLNSLIEDLSSVNAKISQKNGVLNQISEDTKAKQKVKNANKKETKKYVKERVNFAEVDDIMDDIIDEQLNSVFFSLTNMSMVCVMAFSGYLWFKLNKVDGY